MSPAISQGCASRATCETGWFFEPEPEQPQVDDDQRAHQQHHRQQVHEVHARPEIERRAVDAEAFHPFEQRVPARSDVALSPGSRWWSTAG